MKNQTDIICGVSAFVVAVIAIIVIYSTQPTPSQPAAPAAVDTTPPKAPGGSVVYANELPGASNQAGGFGGRGGFAGGPMGGRGFGPGGMMPPGAPPGMAGMAGSRGKNLPGGAGAMTMGAGK
ncbi:MAG TPA: hypothetical protein VG944_21285 [Fimbriimonas sp.]|nr:hypothetical protein [Fimbriimonas sp.]